MKKIDLRVGETYEGGQIIAIHAQENHDGSPAVILLTFGSDRYYRTHRLNRALDVIDGALYADSGQAFFAYAQWVTEMLHTHFNKIAPGLSFAVPSKA